MKVFYTIAIGAYQVQHVSVVSTDFFSVLK